MRAAKNRWLKREKAGHDQTVQEMPTKEERHGQPVQLDIPTQRRKRMVAIGSFANHKGRLPDKNRSPEMGGGPAAGRGSKSISYAFNPVARLERKRYAKALHR